MALGIVILYVHRLKHFHIMMSSGERSGLQKKPNRQAKMTLHCYTHIMNSQLCTQVEADAYIKEHFANTLELAIQGKFTETW